ncbi:AraC family transcriptional regulator [Paraburkholderia tropica]|uniref:AraC family transcriptional regulator n=1 Tax=Paraburkholderia tropica TaxID=92647 RepID=UPI0007ED25E0|nr:AraC family transcriptional regulator [Paraburkholderia tropica]OBR54718.1 hypothetical protein A6456_37910 [Paraburkholderia tropica]
MPSPTTFTLSAAAFAAGAPIKALCTHAGIGMTDKLETDDFFRLWAAAEDHSDDPAAGLRFGAGGIAGGYGVAAIVALHAPDLRRALTSLARYKSLTCPERIDVEVTDEAVFVRYRWLQAAVAVPRLLVDMVLASLAELTRVGTGGRVRPIRVQLARRPGHSDMLRRHFGCPIAFGAAHDAMVFEPAALDVLFLTADGAAFAQVLDGMEQRLRDGEGFPTFVGNVRIAIARQLSAGAKPSVAAVARRLGLSTRTLQRRLDESRTSFGQQLAEVRRLTAGRLLAATNLDTVAIAMLLGFVEPNSFARAFRLWERTTPSRWRELQAAGAT